MVNPKRRVTSNKVPQKVALPAFRYSPSKSPSPDEAPQSPGSADTDRADSAPPGSPDQDEDSNESGTDQSHTTTSSSGDFPRIPVRPRQRFTADETKALEQVYRRNKRPSNEIKQRLARRFNTTMSRIQIWFQNRRAKEKKNNNNSGSQGGSAASNKQEENNDNDDTTPSDAPEQSEPTTSAATSSSSSKRQKVSRKSSATPPAIPESSRSAAKKRKKQKVPTTSATAPVNHPFMPSGGYALAYPSFTTTPMQPVDPPNVPITTMPNEGVWYPGHPPQHPSHARGFFYPKADWHAPIFHPSFAQAFQGPQPTEKPVRYVDPKKVIKPDSSQPPVDHLGQQDTSSSTKSSSRKGKQKQKATELVDSDSEQGSSSEEQLTGDL